MPREHKQRGRRAEEKKRKLDDQDATGHSDTEVKRQRVEQDGDDHVEHDAPLAYEVDTTGEAPAAVDEIIQTAPIAEPVFYGMLDEEEQEYFRKANEIIELNDFAGPEERQLFVDNLFREAQNKELKIANSQSGSRLLERLLQLATPAQLKDMFQKFSGQFVNLIQHRFASHCCEKLFILAAPVVAQEFLRPPKPDATDPDQPFVLMENCFLSTVAELQGNVGFLMNDRFATHTLRVLLLVLAGEPADSPLMKAILQSKRKENVKVSGGGTTSDPGPAKLSVPKTFTDALSSLIQASVAGLDTTNLRALAKHEQANPMLQLLLRIELTHFGKSRGKEQDSIIRRLLPDDTITAESETAIFLNDLIYDSIGSHLVETIVEFAPAKIFKNLFQQFYKERIASLARNEIASYVACKVLERLSRDDLIAVHESLIPVLPRLLELNRVNVIRTLIERCAVRKVDTQAIAVELQSIYADGSGSDTKRFDILRFLHFDNTPDVPDPQPQIPNDAPQSTTQPPLRPAPVSSSQLQSNLLAQAMIASPGPLSALILDSLPHLPTPSLLQLAKSPAPSRTLQAALKAPRPSIASHRILIQAFNGHVASLAVHAVGSHVVDALWHATQGQPPFLRARFAEELVQAEMAIRESVPGRAVWRNWQMDLYKRRRADWIALGKRIAEDVDAGQMPGEEGLGGGKIVDEGTVPVRVKKGAVVAARGENVNGYRGEIVGGAGRRAGANQGPADQGRRKTPLELARERHAQRKAAGAGAGRPNKGAADGVAVET